MEMAAAALAKIGFSSAAAAGTAATAAAPLAVNAAGASFLAGTTAASAGSTLLGALGKTSLWMSALSGGATVLSMMQRQQASEMDALNLESQAEDTKLDIGQERVQGENRRNSIQRALLESIGDRDAAYAASGVDLSFGTPAVARQQASEAAERALNQDSDSENFNVSRLNQRAANLRMRANQTRKSGRTAALVEGLSAGASLLRRG